MLVNQEFIQVLGLRAELLVTRVSQLGLGYQVRPIESHLTHRNPVDVYLHLSSTLV